MEFDIVGHCSRAKWVFKIGVFGALLFVLMQAAPAQAYDPDAPYFPRATFEMLVKENSAQGRVVGRFYAYVNYDVPERDAVTYSVGGEDVDAFNETFDLDTGIGLVTVKSGATVDYESRSRYSLDIMVTDGKDAQGVAEAQPTIDATAKLNIRVENLDDQGWISLSTSSPQVGSRIWATLHDQDGVQGPTFWRVTWARGPTASGPWTYDSDDVSRHISNLGYTPKDKDKYKHLHVIVHYRDNLCGSNIYIGRPNCMKIAHGTSANLTADEDGLIIQQQAVNRPATGGAYFFRYGRSLLLARAKTWTLHDPDGLVSLNLSLANRFRYEFYRIHPVTNDEERVPPDYTYSINAYRVTDADAGRGIRALILFRDDLGHEEMVSTPIEWISAPPNNEATGVPVITGTARVGQTLGTDRSGISDADEIIDSTYTYQWYASDGTEDTAIEGATGSTYIIADTDVGKTITVEVTFQDSYANEEVLTSAPTEVVTAGDVDSNNPATNPPTITGRTQVGETLEVSTTGIADADGIENATFEYQWIRHDLTASTDENIDGATGATYTVEAADEGEGIKVRVSFTDDAGNEEELTSAATGAIQPVNTPATGAPSINGVPRVGVTLAVTTTGIADADGIENATLNATFEYQWVRHDLTASTDENIDGATGSTYTVEAADEGKGIKVRVSFTDDRDNEEELTSNTVLFLSLPPIDSPGKSRGTPVTKTPSKNNPATNPPTITGRTQVGETLEVSTTGIADADGIENATFEYQWVRHDLAASTDENIGGATGATYTVEAADEGKGIKVRVSFTDDRDNEEELTSAATGAVQPELTSSYKHEPTSHDGSTPFTFEVEFTEDPRDDFSYKTMRDHAFTMSGGTVIKARRLVPPGNMEWEITVQPDGDGAVTITLPATTDCAATGAICTEDGGKLSNRMVLTVAAVASQEDPVTEDPVTEDPVTATVLTSSYGESPASHDGSTPFTFEVEFTEDPEDDFSYKTMRDHAFTVSGGTVIKARRLVPPGNVEWEITVQPDGNGAVTITLPATTDCAATGAICTEDGTKLSNRMALTVPGPGRS